MITAQQFAAALRAAADALEANPNAGVQTLTTQTAAVPLAAPAAAPASVTAEQLTDLIMPHVANQTIKDALGVAMRANGVNNLPEARPDQYPLLYTLFKQVLAAHGVGGAPAAAPAASII